MSGVCSKGKRGFPLESASDRAQKHRKVGQVRIPLEFLGFLPDNRGGMGISPFHVHEVAWDVVANTTKTTRYREVEVVKLPDDRRASVLESNEHKCEESSLMPKHSPTMTYGCLSKTHFVHAQKLAQEATQTLFGEGNIKIRFRDDDKEGHLISESGPICVVYDSALLEDPEALSSVMSDDNLNASVQMSEDEMQAFGRVHGIFEALAPSQSGTLTPITESAVLDQLRLAGLGQFTEEQWSFFIQLRSKMPPKAVKVLQTCQFHSASGRSRVRPADFGVVAKLDPRCPWVMVAILIFQYASNVSASAGFGHSSSMTFSGRVENFAKKLNAIAFKELEQEGSFVRTLEAFIREMFVHYQIPADSNAHLDSEKLLDARTIVLSACGRMIVNFASTVNDIALKGQALSQSLTEDAKKAWTEEAKAKARIQIMKNKFAKIEQSFRDKLIAAHAFTTANIKPAKHVLTDSEHKADAQGSKSTSKEAQPLLVPRDESDCVLTESDVMKRLGIDGPGGYALISMAVARHFLHPTPEEALAAKDEPDGDAARGAAGVAEVTIIPSADTSSAAAAHKHPPLDNTVVRAKIMSFSLPKVHVALQVEGASALGCWVQADDLMPVASPSGSKVRVVKPNEPALVTADDVVETRLQYDFAGAELNCTRALAEYAIAWAHLPTSTSVLGVRVHLLSDKGKLPFMFRVVAEADFKKGELVLAPYGGTLCRPESIPAMEASHKGKVVMHAALKSSVPLEVRTLSKALSPTANRFSVISPLMQGRLEKQRETCYDNIAPFWAVCRAAASSPEHTMELETMLFTDGGLATKTGKYPRMAAGTSFAVGLEVYRNVRKITKGDVLLCPFEERS